jgi:hypothetical protein
MKNRRTLSMKRNSLVTAHLPGTTRGSVVFSVLLFMIYSPCLRAQVGDNNPTGVSGIFNGQAGGCGFGTLNRLWVLGQSQVFQIDATTGASTGPSIGSPPFIYSGSLEISPDRNTLYYCDYGLSPSTMYKIDVSGTNPVLLLQTPFGTVGSNGEDLTLSHNGSYICYTVGSGQNSYDIAKFRTSDFASLGSFVTGPYPQTTAFSPDDLVVYASVHTASGIKAFDANTFLYLGTMAGPEVASKLAVDSTGRYLFAAYDTYFGFLGTIVFDTGRSPRIRRAPRLRLRRCLGRNGRPLVARRFTVG